RAADDRLGRRIRAPSPTGRRHGRRAHPVAGADVVHDTGDLSCVRPRCAANGIAAAADRGSLPSRRNQGPASALMNPRIATRSLVLGTLPALVLAIAGCAVGPDYVRPAAPSAGEFKEAQRWKRARPADDALRQHWWEMFEDPDLNALEREINIANQPIAVA